MSSFCKGVGLLSEGERKQQSQKKDKTLIYSFSVTDVKGGVSRILLKNKM